MAVVVIGGHTRNIGKTSVVCGLIAAMPEKRWTAIKITQCDHGVCSANGEPCDCEAEDHTVAIRVERDAASGTDSSRYLAAGAVRSIWARTREGQLAAAMPRICREIAGAQNVILESNSVLQFLDPDVYASVLNPEIVDFKRSALRYVERADALLIPLMTLNPIPWKDFPLKLVERIPRFPIGPPAYSSPEFSEFVAEKLRIVGK